MNCKICFLPSFFCNCSKIITSDYKISILKIKFGKLITKIENLPTSTNLPALLKYLKKLFSVRGSILSSSAIEIAGSHKEKLIPILDSYLNDSLSN